MEGRIFIWAKKADKGLFRKTDSKVGDLSLLNREVKANESHVAIVSSTLSTKQDGRTRTVEVRNL